MRGGDRKRVYGCKCWWFGVGDDAAGQIELARYDGPDGLVRRPSGLLEGFEDGGGIGIENSGLW